MNENSRLPAVDPEHDMWVRELPAGELLIGATAFGIHLAGEIIAFTSKPNGAEAAWPTPAREKSIAAFLDEAAAAGVCFYACSMARAAWVKAGENLRAEVGAAGATAFVARTLDPEWRTLVY